MAEPELSSLSFDELFTLIDVEGNPDRGGNNRDCVKRLAKFWTDCYWQLATISNHAFHDEEALYDRWPPRSGEARNALFRRMRDTFGDSLNTLLKLLSNNGQQLDNLAADIDGTYRQMKAWRDELGKGLVDAAEGPKSQQIWTFFGFPPSAAQVARWQNEVRDEYAVKARELMTLLSRHMRDVGTQLTRVNAETWKGPRGDFGTHLQPPR